MPTPHHPSSRAVSAVRGLAMLAALIASLSMAPPARAVDLAADYGTQYLSHMAVHAALTDNPGDQPGYPLSITRSGTYRLVQDLGSSDPSDVIHVADGVTVTIDLNGFSLQGRATCSRTVVCNAPQGTVGVRLLGPRAHARVINGSIGGFTQAAVSAFGLSGGTGGTLILQDLKLAGNGSGVVGNRAVASRLIVRDNSLRGVWAQVLQLSDSQIEGNGGGNLSGGLNVAGTNIAGPERN